MIKNISKYLFFILFLLLLSFLITFQKQTIKINNLQQQIITKQQQITFLTKNITVLKEKLISLNNALLNQKRSYDLLMGNYSFIKEKFEKLQNNYSSLEGKYDNLQDEVNLLIEKIENFQSEIQSSLEWYKYNANLHKSPEENKVKYEIERNCYKIKNDDCYIKLGCFYFINDKKLNLKYRNDEDLYGRNDKLTSLSEFLQNKGGDCEDYSLFFKAEYNYAFEKCQGKEIHLDAWTDSGGNTKTKYYWLTFRKNWYFSDVETVLINDFIYPNIICGNLYDPNKDEISGHCMIAFTKKRIETISDLIYLDGAYIIEPQNGKFMGNINDQNSGVYLLNETLWYDDSILSWIDSVITDNDFFNFNRQTLIWESYSSLYESFENKKNQLLQLI